MRNAIIAIVLVMMCVLPLPAQAEDMVWVWAAPADGTPVVRYVVDLSTDGGEWVSVGPTVGSNPTWTLDARPNVEYRLRVAGVDADGEQGIWSIVSDVSVNAQPGQPGQPSCASCGG